MLSLVHQLQGAFGNQLIVEDVNEADFFVSGMGGGGGADCLAGVGCVTDDDCAPTLICGNDNNLCAGAPE